MRRLLFILITLLVILISSCDPPLECDTGTHGVSASFSDRNSIRTMEQNRTVPVVVSIKNEGASPTQGIVRLRHNQDLVRVNPNNITFSDLPGKEDWNRCLGQEERVVFDVNPYPLPITAQRFDTDLTLDICYEYETNFSTTVCVDPRSQGINVLDPNCVPGERTFRGGQGGPLGIVRVSAPVYYDDDGGSVRIRFTLENFRNGRIVSYSTDSLDHSCSLHPDVFENYISVDAYLDDKTMECTELNPDFDRYPQNDDGSSKTYLRPDPEQMETRDGMVTLRRLTFVCTASDIGIERELDMQLRTEMRYYYRDTRSDSITTELRKI